MSARQGSPRPRVSVVIATYNRPALLERLLGQLAAQTFPADRFEVVVVDDGSKERVATALERLALPFELVTVEQTNAGAAAARHNGALKTRGEVLVILDDDMQVPPSFVASHEGQHSAGKRKVVLGRIRPDPALGSRPLFERYNAVTLDRVAARYARGISPRGNNLCTGNVSMLRADYLAVGGFDLSLERSEDAELGLRLERAGCELTFCEEAYSLHGSDHDQLATFLGRAHRYGRYDQRISKKHAELPYADPWRYLFSLSLLTRPFVGAAVVTPSAARLAAKGLMYAALAGDQVGLESVAIRATGVVYGMEYFRGLRDEAGSLGSAMRACGDFLVKAARSPQDVERAPRRLAQALRAVADLRADHQVRQGYEDKYGFQGPRGGALGVDLVQKIGLQISGAYRLMRFFRDAGVPLGAKVTSRLIRHLYGSDLHWDATLAPGVVFVHGMGLAVSSAAKVGPGCILSQNVTLGMGVDPVTRQQGAPTLEANVHVGPGATLLGPITIGEGSKIMAGAVVTRSVPPGSLVEPPAPKVSPRKGAGAPVEQAKEGVKGEAQEGLKDDRGGLPRA